MSLVTILAIFFLISYNHFTERYEQIQIHNMHIFMTSTSIFFNLTTILKFYLTLSNSVLSICLLCFHIADK